MMKDFFEQLDEEQSMQPMAKKKPMEDKMDGGDKLSKLAEDVKAVAAEMGMGAPDILEKLQGMCGEEGEEKEYAQDDSEKEVDDEKGAKKALVVAMLKRKNADA